jgi:hypothetical protein
MTTLNPIHSMFTLEGLFLVTAPNTFRRFPLHASPDGRASGNRDVRSRWTSMRRYFPQPRLITYHHHIENAQQPFPYYLFSLRELASELSAAGFLIEILESGSILPERRLVGTPLLKPVDNLLRRLLPSWIGYALRAVCRASPQ